MTKRHIEWVILITLETRAAFAGLKNLDATLCLLLKIVNLKPNYIFIYLNWIFAATAKFYEFRAQNAANLIIFYWYRSSFINNQINKNKINLQIVIRRFSGIDKQNITIKPFSNSYESYLQATCFSKLRQLSQPL